MSNSILEFHTTDTTTHEFRLNIKGTKAAPIPRLLIPVNENGAYLCIPGAMKDGVAEIDVPGIGGLFQETTKPIGNVKLEVIVDGTLHTPWSGKGTIKEPVKVMAESLTTVEQETEPEVPEVVIEATSAKTTCTKKKDKKSMVPKMEGNEYI